MNYLLNCQSSLPQTRQKSIADILDEVQRERLDQPCSVGRTISDDKDNYVLKRVDYEGKLHEYHGSEERIYELERRYCK